MGKKYHGESEEVPITPLLCCRNVSSEQPRRVLRGEGRRGDVAGMGREKGRKREGDEGGEGGRRGRRERGRRMREKGEGKEGKGEGGKRVRRGREKGRSEKVEMMG